MVTAVFTYGTLEIPRVLEAVTGRIFRSVPASLPGYERFVMRDRDYPGIREARGCSTPGTLYLGVDPPSIALLDRFEDDVYERQVVRVTTERGQTLAYAYVLPQGQRDRLTSQPWDRMTFERRGLARYLASRSRSARAAE